MPLLQYYRPPPPAAQPSSGDGSDGISVLPLDPWALPPGSGKRYDIVGFITADAATLAVFKATPGRMMPPIEFAPVKQYTKTPDQTHLLSRLIMGFILSAAVFVTFVQVLYPSAKLLLLWINIAVSMLGFGYIFVSLLLMFFQRLSKSASQISLQNHDL
jgi:hypothetical protein